jgi:hypothetical protein
MSVHDVNTDLQKGDIVVILVCVELFVFDDSCYTVNNSTIFVVCGASSDSEKTNLVLPVDRKILNIILCQ